MPSRPLQGSAEHRMDAALAPRQPARSAGLDLSLGHLSTHPVKRPLPPSVIRWRVWVLLDGQWKRSAGAMPEGAALSYALHVRHATAFALEAEHG